MEKALNSMNEASSALLREHYFFTTHPSGLPIYIFPKKLTTAFAYFAVRYGSTDNCFCVSEKGTPERVPAGVAHFLEHKLFENEDGSDAFEQFAALGADANAYTSYNKTAYLFSCTENFEAALSELLRFVLHPHFTDASVKKEQGIITEEIREYDDRPWERCFQNLLCAMYRENPVRENICGSAESIRKITPELLYRCHASFYRPSNMALIVCGDVDPETVLKIADAHLPTEALDEPIRRGNVNEPEEVAKTYVEQAMQVSKPLFSIGIKDPVLISDPDARLRRDLCVNLLCEILFSRAGEFYSGLFEQGIVTPSFSYGYSSTETFAFTCISGESDEPERVLALLKDYLARVRTEGLDREDFERCRRAMYADELRAYDSTEEIASRLLSFVLEGTQMFSCPDVIQSITLNETETLLSELFADERFALSVIRPLK
ncbi:MAG: insulinase family protein [Clostridia bacterium]|nr:insulinase family protein [Clostridia bacterium]